MGVWDIFCFICGNTCHTMFSGYEQDFSENIVKKLNELNKKINWFSKCTFLKEDDTIIHNVIYGGTNIGFSKGNNEYEHISYGFGKYILRSNDISYGYFSHTDCWKYIKKNYNINLKFSNLPPYITNKYDKTFDINYGEIENYWGQDFNFPMIINDNKQYLCSSPLKNDKNIKQIKKNINSLKLKNDPDRKGPSVSATFFSEGDIKLGNNKFFWTIKNGKWIEIKEKPIKMKIKINLNKIDKKEKKIIDNLPYIGYYNKVPIFLLSMKSDKNNIELNLILLDSIKNKLKFLS